MWEMEFESTAAAIRDDLKEHTAYETLSKIGHSLVASALAQECNRKGVDLDVVAQTLGTKWLSKRQLVNPDYDPNDLQSLRFITRTQNLIRSYCDGWIWQRDSFYATDLPYAFMPRIEDLLHLEKSLGLERNTVVKKEFFQPQTQLAMGLLESDMSPSKAALKLKRFTAAAEREKLKAEVNRQRLIEARKVEQQKRGKTQRRVASLATGLKAKFSNVLDGLS